LSGSAGRQSRLFGDSETIVWKTMDKHRGATNSNRRPVRIQIKNLRGAATDSTAAQCWGHFRIANSSITTQYQQEHHGSGEFHEQAVKVEAAEAASVN